ncbi:MAG: hypothetical protein C0468_04545 [Planctomyces sp.]|nr:hypothetical protein [Planctomyces sp.]
MAQGAGTTGGAVRGPGLWAAVAVLGALSASGLAWSVWRQVRAWDAEVGSQLTGSAGIGPGAGVGSAGAGDAGGPGGEAGPAGAAGVASTGGPPAQGGLDINTASAAELELLPGIGPALAARIVEHRATRGRFVSVEDLDEVRGIGPKTMERLRGLVRVGQ